MNLLCNLTFYQAEVGRGLLSALGIGFDLKPGDVTACSNFCTVDEAGRF
jgi:2,3-bisphosphoglycerate-independent phosphoglycerate mutase